VSFAEKMDRIRFIMVIFLKVVYGGGDLAQKVEGWRDIT
jgi:hypothetical protein